MQTGALYALAADAVLLAHVLFVGFIVFGLICIVLGKLRCWAWVRNPWFRYAHLAVIGFVVFQSWFGAVCPLTRWEMALRAQAGESVYAGAFIAHWLEAILYYRAPEWVFAACYSVFGALVVGTWYWVRPRWFAPDRLP